MSAELFWNLRVSRIVNVDKVIVRIGSIVDSLLISNRPILSGLALIHTVVSILEDDLDNHN